MKILTKEQKKELKKIYLRTKAYEEWEKDNEWHQWTDIDEELERCRTIYR